MSAADTAQHLIGDRLHAQFHHDEGAARQPGEAVRPFGRDAVRAGGDDKSPYVRNTQCLFKAGHHVGRRRIGVAAGLEVGQVGDGGVSAHLPAVETFAPFELYGHREDGSRRRGDEAASVAKGAARCAGAAIAHRAAGTAVDGQFLYLGGEASGEKCRIGGEWKWFGHGRGACAPIIYKVYGGGGCLAQLVRNDCSFDLLCGSLAVSRDSLNFASTNSADGQVVYAIFRLWRGVNGGTGAVILIIV